MYKVIFAFLLFFLSTVCRATENQTGSCYYKAPIVICEHLSLDDNDSIPNNVTDPIFDWMFLYNFTGSVSVKTSLKNFPQVTYLNIQRSAVKSFDPDSFNLTDFYIWESDFPDLNKSVLQSCCSSLSSMDLRLKTTKITGDTFQNLPSLGYLKIANGTIVDGILRADAFNGTKVLSILKMDNVSILSIDENAFQYLDQLRILVLQGNKITRFGNNTFKNLRSLKNLTIDEQNLTSFDATILNELDIYALRVSLQLSRLIDYKTLVQALSNLGEILVFIDEESQENLLDVQNFCAQFAADGINCRYSLRYDLE